MPSRTLRTILVLEDECDFFELIKEFLEGAGLGVRSIWAKDSSEAVEVLATTKVDAVVTDYHQPPGNAEPLLRYITEDGGLSQLDLSRVICMSAHKQPVGGFKSAINAGASFLHKCEPQFASKLVAQVRQRFASSALPEAA